MLGISKPHTGRPASQVQPIHTGAALGLNQALVGLSGEAGAPLFPYLFLEGPDFCTRLLQPSILAPLHGTS